MTNSHRNDERTVRCPVEGCDAEPPARGIDLHIRRSSGDGHGPQGEIPDHIDLDNLEAVGEREVQMDYPEERETEDIYRLCPYCSMPYSGENGVLIHLGQMAGRKNHPENAADQHAAGDFPRVEVDEFENITEVSDENPASSCSATETGTVPVERVYHLIADLVADGQTRTAHRVRRALLGTDNALATNRDDPSHPELFEALLSQGRTDRTDYQVTVALEGEGLMVACHGESALLTAEEAREIAARLEQVATSEDWREEEVRELVAFLQCGADVLEDKKPEQELREEFNYWR